MQGSCQHDAIGVHHLHLGRNVEGTHKLEEQELSGKTRRQLFPRAGYCRYFSGLALMAFTPPGMCISTNFPKTKSTA